MAFTRAKSEREVFLILATIPTVFLIVLRSFEARSFGGEEARNNAPVGKALPYQSVFREYILEDMLCGKRSINVGGV